jgi:hypothetical protein
VSIDQIVALYIADYPGGQVGTFRTTDEGYHVGPCNTKGLLLENHTFSQNCFCKPELKTYKDRDIWVHDLLIAKGMA